MVTLLLSSSTATERRDSYCNSCRTSGSLILQHTTLLYGDAKLMISCDATSWKREAGGPKYWMNVREGRKLQRLGLTFFCHFCLDRTSKQSSRCLPLATAEDIFKFITIFKVFCWNHGIIPGSFHGDSQMTDSDWLLHSCMSQIIFIFLRFGY